MESGGEVPSTRRATEELVLRAGVKYPRVHQRRLSSDPGNGH